MTSLDLRILTFNCARALIDVSSFALLVLDPLFTHQSTPDIVVFSLQEIAPIAQSFLGGSYLQSYFGAFVDALNITAQTQGEHVYENIVAKNVGMTALMVFAKSDIVDRVRGIETGGAGVGMAEMGNKGAVGARIRWAGSGEEEDTYTTFVAAHLAPMEGAVQRRNEDWGNIVRNLVFTPERATSTSGTSVPGTAYDEQQPLLSHTDSSPSQHTIYTSSTTRSYLFLAGDLNYRTRDTPPDPNAYKSWPQPTSNRNAPYHFSKFLSSDQLTHEKDAGHTLHHLEEAPINFPPTYKYEHPFSSSSEPQETGSDGDDGSDDSNAPVITNDLQAAKNARFSKDPYATETWIWAKHRAPSWCDRILFFPSPALKVQKYAALPILSTSDHRPVALAASISVSAQDGTAAQEGEEMESPFPVNPLWKREREQARRREQVAGVVLYLATTNEGRMIAVAVAVGLFAGALALRRYLGYQVFL
ncbi:DNase I-like protein [Viridothelium virens]|uniref:DNase I-like protein n=1 Tax=Viridothelium virens TaxID=1048519 RepID=A0A6A6H1R1_VIRVR|nr:DNase I-like protein [Viridothelium virens]